MKNMVITGSTGFVGSNLLKELIKNDNNKLYLIVRRTSDLSIVEKYLNEEVEIFRYDGQIKELIKYFKKVSPDLVIHLASVYITEHKETNINSLIQSNIIFGTHILEAMKQSKTKRIINTGTSWQHYKYDSDEYNPANLYAATKQAFEDILKYYSQSEEISVINLKLFDTYGPNDRRRKLINLLIDAVENDIELDMSEGLQEISLTYIDDVIEAYLKAIKIILKENKVIFETYGVYSNEIINLRELVETFSKVYGKMVKVNFGKRNYRKREVMKVNKKIKTVPNWNPVVDLENGLNFCLR